MKCPKCNGIMFKDRDFKGDKYWICLDDACRFELIIK